MTTCSDKTIQNIWIADYLIPFTDVVLGNEAVMSRLDEETVRRITDSLEYLGESKRIVRMIAEKYHKKKTLV